MDIYTESTKLHRKLGGKLTVELKHNISNRHDLSLIYTPGVAQPCLDIHSNPELAYDLTIKKNSVAVISDGSAVLGLGNIGGLASLPVMEGKAALFKAYADIDAFPICLNTQETDEIINIVKNIAPAFGGINLEDISAPRCFEIENSLQDIGIPVFHDDQHGTAVVVYAGLINALKLVDKRMSDLTVVINGAGAAGIAISDMLLGTGYPDITPVNNVILCDSKGIISKSRSDIKNNAAKNRIAKLTNKKNISGPLARAMENADIFIGVSAGNVVDQDMIRSMSSRAVVFPMSNPTPEIMPDLAKSAGAYIIGTGRSDFPNQINNVLAFPGIFRGAIDARASKISNNMKIAAAYALADYITNPDVDNIIPSALDKKVAAFVGQKVKEAYLKEQVN
ncbi:MAG: NADP-dependent malic enzyme [bacterium]|nr:NADP-dependent malic enzyme [bacterium]